MKRFALVLLWIGYSFLVLEVGTLLGRHNAGSEANFRAYEAGEACEKRKSELMRLDGPALTDRQHEALFNICTPPRSVDGHTGMVAPLAYLIPLLAGLILYLVANVREARKVEGVTTAQR